MSWLCLVAPLAAAEPDAKEDIEFFEKHIRPLLVERCVKCHGGEKTEAGLALTSRAALIKGGDTGPSVKLDKPSESLLLEVIGYQGDIQMPPDAKLADEQILLVRKWIEIGAPWPGKDDGLPLAGHGGFRISDEQRAFWAFQPIAPQTPPVVKHDQWPQRPLDRFILAGLEAKELMPAPPADKRTLLRRVTFDLTGLPPTPMDVENFLKDKSPEAYARVIDRLLASPQYGERWARHWLDVVRYTDSADARGVGGEMDFAEAWRYRDWVVDAFNNDLPYDEFIQQQIAGDLLPGNGEGGFNRAGTIATGMLAIGNWGGGDADKEKLLTDIADDQVDVVSRAFLGLTVACARCHDHKFDPISTEDYYALAGIFFSSHILRDPGPKTNGPPILRIPLASSAELARRQEREKQLQTLARQVEEARDAAIAQQASVWLPQTSQYIVALKEWQRSPGKPAAEVARQYAVNEIVLERWLAYVGNSTVKLLDRPLRDIHQLRGLHAYASASDTPALTVNTSENEAAFLTIKLPPRAVAVHPGPQSAVAIAWKSSVDGDVQITGKVRDGDNVCGNGIEWKLVLRSGRLSRLLVAGEISNGGSQELIAAVKEKGGLDRVRVRPGEMLELSVHPKGEYICDTTVIEWQVAEVAGERRVWNLTNDLLPNLHAGNPHPDAYGQPEIWQFYELVGNSNTLAPIGAGSALAQLLETDGELQAKVEQLNVAIPKATADVQHADAGWVRDFLSAQGAFWKILRERNELLTDEQRSAITKIATERDTLQQAALPPLEFANGCQDGGCPQSPHAGTHNVRVHIRGRYDRLGPEVPRRFPIVLAGEQQEQITQGSGRAQLAQWVASERQPLAARVIVNRLWQHHFGRGIVGTPNNFGKLGERPTHPELLDYLARMLIEQRWSLKQLHRELLLSATYQQSSVGDEANLQRDPDNRLWGRMSRRRLEAEAIRDSLLVVANRLQLKPAGPAVRGFEHNRRTLYAMTIRSDRSTFRELFDAADSTAIVEARIHSTVAPQALYFLNHPFTQQISLDLAKRVQTLDVASDDARIVRLYEWLYARPPVDRELTIARAFLGHAPNEQQWEAYCHVLLCANEFVYVD